MHIKLIKPAERPRSGVLLNKTTLCMDAALPLLAALTPPQHQVTLVDESFAPDDRTEDVDVVGISAWTDLAIRAYAIAEHYRSRGTIVVMGGIHPTMCPDEAQMHCDAVVVGEGDQSWPTLLADIERGALRRRYDFRDRIPRRLEDLPHPRRDLYPALTRWNPVPPAVGIEASRGCPYDCEFCSVLEVRGHRYRHRPVEEIVAEIATIGASNLVFVDDNVALDRKRAKALFRRMIGMGKEWVAEAGVGLAEDTELLRLMRASGCRGLMVGFESVQPQTIDGMRKLRRMRLTHMEVVERFHDAGIPVMGNFVFGFDHETFEVFDLTLDFAFRSQIELAQFKPLVPYPGTPLFSRLLREGRLLDAAWWRNPKRIPGEATPLFYPAQMSPEQLAEGLLHLARAFYGARGRLRRLRGLRPWRRTLVETALLIGMDWAFGSRYLSAFRFSLDRTRALPVAVRQCVASAPPEVSR
ncbi:MAG: B12-binding domain-containing radical SAM protein [Deltaproteobacteria bacterium]|nr:B12-binding domain-containing radical SAM protein [Deltaproteobacteria bacterium]